MNRYRTIRETDDSVETLYEIQKSRFITHIPMSRLRKRPAASSRP